MLCTVISGPDYAQASKQIEQSKTFSSLFEFRLDLLKECEKKEISLLKKEAVRKVLFTFKGESEERMRDYLTLQPYAVDFDEAVSLQFLREIKNRYPQIYLLRSFHSSEWIEDLEALYQSLKVEDVDCVKIAIQVESVIDSLKLIEFQKKKGSTLLSLAMGEKGILSRVFNVSFQAPWTYAAPSKESVVAPGQLTAEEMSLLYRVQGGSEKRQIYALIGSPVQKSIGHIVHGNAFSQFGVDAIYVKLDVKKEELSDFFKFVRFLPFKGLSVTMPHKEEVLAFLDVVDEDALEKKAVNTVWLREGKLYGSNTDGEGAVSALLKKTTLLQKQVALVGAGGAARAIAIELRKAGAGIDIFNRTKEKAERLAMQVGGRGFALKDFTDTYDIVINCTPLELPIEKLSESGLVMETNIRPLMSSFLQLGKEKGKEVVFGYEMFVEQALLQWKYWFSSSFPKEQLSAHFYATAESQLVK